MFIKSNEFYDAKVIWRSIFTILAVFAAMKFSRGAGFVVVVPFVLMAIFQNRVRQMLFWILLTNMLVVTNDFFVPKGFVFAVGYRVLLLGVGLYGILQFFSLRSSKLVLPLLGVFVYLFYMILPSLQGFAPKVACLKLILFSATYMTFAFVSTKAQATKTLDMRKVRSMLLAICIVYVVGSVLVYPFPSISMMNAQDLLRSGGAGGLYKGMTNHSQTMGMFMCCWMCFILSDMFFNVQKPDWLYIGLILCGVVLIVKTSSRTAMGSLLATVFFLAYNVMRAHAINVRWKSKVISTLTLLFVFAAAAMIAIPSVRDKVAKKAMKWGAEETTAESFTMERAVMSRMGLVDYSLYLWRLRPTIGWGFQVSPRVGELEKKSGGLVLSAPVEKGVWVTAVLEEGGVFGEIIYVGYALFAFLLLMLKRAYMGSTVFLLIHIANLGEFTMFSMSGIGCVWYAVLFVSLVFDAKRLQGAMGGRMRGPMGGPGFGPQLPMGGPGIGPRMGRELPPGGQSQIGRPDPQFGIRR